MSYYPGFVPTQYRSPWLGIAALLVIAFMVWRIGKARGWFGDPPPPDTPLPPGAPSAGFSPVPYATRLKQLLEAWSADGGPRCEEYKRLMQLTDIEFVMVANEFAKRAGKSLQAAINATWSSCSIFGTRYDTQVLNRLTELNVNG